MKARLRQPAPRALHRGAAAPQPMQTPNLGARQPAMTAPATPAQRLHDSQRMVAQRSRLASAFGIATEQPPRTARAETFATGAPVQRMAVSAITDFKQAGGTCGLYSLGMAMSGVDGSLTGRKPELLRRILAAGNAVGSFVGEFMDADNLAKVGRTLGFGANVIDFGDATDMKDKLTATGGAGVVMGYSVFDDAGYQADFPPHLLALSTFKHLFSHWSVIESLANDKLAVRDPNDPGSTRSVDAAAFHKANADADNASGKFSFGEFEAQGLGNVKDLRTTWEGEELGTRGGGVPATSPLPAQGQPEVDLKLKGKMVSVSGSLQPEVNVAAAQATTALARGQHHAEASLPLTLA